VSDCEPYLVSAPVIVAADAAILVAATPAAVTLAPSGEARLGVRSVRL
jgi:hypothetical protein